MLYISSINGTKYRISDTETGESYWMVEFDLRSVLRSGEKILGAIELPNGRFALSVYPYAENVQQMKNLFLYGYVYKVEDGVLKSLIFDSKHNKDITLRLSDLCESVDDYSICLDSVNRIFVRLIFDDKIKHVGSDAFSALSSLRIQCILDEVTNENLLRECYAALVPIEFSRGSAAIVRDLPERYGIFSTEAEFLCLDCELNGLTEKEDEHIIKYNKDYILNLIPDEVFLYYEDFIKKINMDDLRYDFSRLKDDYAAGKSSKYIINTYWEVFDILNKFCFSSRARIATRYLRAGGRCQEIREKYFNYVDRCCDILENGG